jgi:hypothetical protein
LPRLEYQGTHRKGRVGADVQVRVGEAAEKELEEGLGKIGHAVLEAINGLCDGANGGRPLPGLSLGIDIGSESRKERVKGGREEGSNRQREGADQVASASNEVGVPFGLLRAEFDLLAAIFLLARMLLLQDVERDLADGLKV